MMRGLNDPLTAIAVNLRAFRPGAISGQWIRFAAETDARMIVACPSCATRYDVPQGRLKAQGSMMKCSACGNSWIESGPVSIVDVPVKDLPAVIDYDAPSEREIERLVEAARIAREEFAARKQARMRRLRGWGALAATLVLPLGAAFAFPEDIVRAAPGAARLYEAAGYSINIYGLEIRSVEQQHLILDGQRMLAVKGLVVNVSNDERKVPALRFGLKDAEGKEVYYWTTAAGGRPLRPGEVNNFVTRIQAPPPNGEKLEIRFARIDEIGSNTVP
jgi:predicted Zn finger-like uncharacterized protein